MAMQDLKDATISFSCCVVKRITKSERKRVMAAGKVSNPNWVWMASWISLVLGFAVHGLTSVAMSALLSCVSAVSISSFSWTTESPGRSRLAICSRAPKQSAERI